MSPPTQAERRAHTRAAILSAAQACFVRDGYEATTIRGVAAEAGVSAASVIVHFADKRALLFACFYGEIEAAQHRIWESIDEEWSLADELEHCLRVLYAAYARHPALSRVMFRESLFLREQDPPDEQLDPFLTRVARLFVQALERGEIRELPGEGMVAARGFFALYIAVLIGGLGGHFGEFVSPEAAARAWTEALRPMLWLQLRGLGWEAPHE